MALLIGDLFAGDADPRFRGRVLSAPGLDAGRQTNRAGLQRQRAGLVKTPLAQRRWQHPARATDERGDAATRGSDLLLSRWRCTSLRRVESGRIPPPRIPAGTSTSCRSAARERRIPFSEHASMSIAALLARRAMDCLPFERIRALRGFRPAVSGPGLQVADLGGRRSTAPMVSEWPRALLSERGQDDGRRGRNETNVSRRPAADALRRRFPGSYDPDLDGTRFPHDQTRPRRIGSRARQCRPELVRGSETSRLGAK